LMQRHGLAVQLLRYHSSPCLRLCSRRLKSAS
jgi:hypothetical protein